MCFIMVKHKTTPVPSPVDDRILEVRELAERLTLDRTTLWRMVQNKQFPPPIRLTKSRIGWRWSTVLAWLAQREAHPVRRRAFFGKGKGAATDAA
jgi:predicted DNA-binding transcriptional regulator AlpA